MSRCQPKVSELTPLGHLGHLPTRETEIKRDAGAVTAHTTILPSRSTTHRRLVFPKILRHARHLDHTLLNWIIYHSFSQNRLFILHPREPLGNLGAIRIQEKQSFVSSGSRGLSALDVRISATPHLFRRKERTQISTSSIIYHRPPYML